MKSVIIDLAKKKKNLFKLHAISKKWVADLEFMNDEHHFLQDLISSFFIDLCSVDYFPETRKLRNKLEESNNKGNLLLLEIRTHSKKLSTLLESSHLDGEESFRKKQKKLANKFDQFIFSSKLLKSRVFAIIKNIMKQHKQKLLLSHPNPQESNSSKP